MNDRFMFMSLPRASLIVYHIFRPPALASNLMLVFYRFCCRQPLVTIDAIIFAFAAFRCHADAFVFLSAFDAILSDAATDLFFAAPRRRAANQFFDDEHADICRRADTETSRAYTTV